MNDPFSVKLNTSENMRRAEQFEAALSERAATGSEVIRGLIDAYIESRGSVSFPVKLVAKEENCNSKGN